MRSRPTERWTGQPVRSGDLRSPRSRRLPVNACTLGLPMPVAPFREPPQRIARWEQVARLTADWFETDSSAGGVDPSEMIRAERRLGLALPLALHEWYLRFGNLPKVWNVQDEVFAPHEFEVDNGYLVIGRENQGVFSWGIAVAALGEADPAVTIVGPGEPNHLQVAAPTLTEFAIGLLLLNVKFSQSRLFRANGQIPHGAVETIEASISRLPVPDLHWYASPVRLFGDHNITVEIDGGAWLWITAKESVAFERVVCLAEGVGMSWEAIERPA